MAETICTILDHWARARPDAEAFVFLGDGEQVSDSASYAAFARRVRSVGHAIRGHAEAGDRVIVLHPPSGDFVISLLGCMRGGGVAVPVAPARRRQTAGRLGAILNDADASVIVTTLEFADAAREAAASAARRPVIILCDEIDTDAAPEWDPAAVAIDDLALLQYTSGSTGRPKGVALTHGNLAANQRMIRAAFEHDQTFTSVSWLPQYHDMGLIGDGLNPIWSGGRRVAMPHQAFIERPIRWLRAIAQYENVTSGGPDFAYEHCVRRITDEQCEGLDLSRWRVAYTGSEPVRAETLDRFTRKFGRWGFRPEAFLPCYGLAEASLLVSAGPGPGRRVEARVDAKAMTRGAVVACDGGKRLVGCGEAADETTVRIVDPVTCLPCDPDQIGEIWVSSPSIAIGYWQQEATSDPEFRARVGDEDATYLRTGDLGFLHDRQLFIVGRNSDKIIIRGKNLHPHDVEDTVQGSHHSLEPHAGAAFAVDRDGRETLVVVQEVRRHDRQNVDAAAVRSAVRRAVSRAHGVQVSDLVLLRPGSVLKTTSGKIRRKEMRRRYVDFTLEAIETTSAAPADVSASMGPAVACAPVTDVDELLHWLRDYGDRRLNSRLMDERKCIPPHVILDLGNRGVLGLQGPREFGGLGLGHRDTMRVFEQLGALDQSLALFAGIHNVLGTGPILRAATPSTRAELLPRLVSGRELGAFALTEPGAGSNPRAIRTRAVPAGRGRWRLYGTKYWSGAAAWAGVINVFAKLENETGEGRGSVAFAVRQDAPGLRQGAEAPTMGMRAMVQNTIHLEGVEVGVEDMLGAPGQGLQIAQDAMMYGRLAIASASLGGMRRCAQLMHRYASRRTIAGEPLGHNAVTLDRLGSTTAAIAGLDAVVARLAELLDQDAQIPDEIYAAVKILAPELVWSAADRLMQMLGGRGYIETNEAPQILRDARILRIFEGPTEAMCAYLGARLVNDESGLIGFLETRLRAPDAARAVRDVLDKHRDTLHHGDLASRTRLRYRLGDLAAWAVLTGALESAPTERPYRWARALLERRATTITADVVEITFDEVTAEIDGYAEQIGDVEQSMAGEDTARDPLLRRAPPALTPAPDDDEVEISILVTEPPAPRSDLPGSAATVTRTVAEIEGWLKAWIADRLELSPSEVDTLVSFADLGADSVTAVELVIDLGEFVGQTLDDTLPWEAPNIAAVAERLGSANGGLAKAPRSTTGTTAGGDHESDHESDLAASLRELEQRLGGS